MIIQVYAPTIHAEKKNTEEFNGQFQPEINKRLRCVACC